MKPWSVLVPLLLALGPGCIVPVGPEWRDPLAAKNIAPRIVSSRPLTGSVVYATGENATAFNVRVTDDNVGDTIYLRLLADYPPFDYEITRMVVRLLKIPPRADGLPVNLDVPLEVPPCSQNVLAPGLPTHQIYVVAADRPFVDAVDDPVQVEEGGLSIDGSWTLDLDCGR